MNERWNKVVECKHDNIDTDYIDGGLCESPYCTWSEYRCLDCGAYISKCGCGYNNGISSWPHTRWDKMIKEKQEEIK